MTADPLTPDEWESVKDLVFACHLLDRDAQAAWLDEHFKDLGQQSSVDLRAEFL